jgi:hypothetical protein
MTKSMMPPPRGGGQPPKKPANPALRDAHTELETAATLLRQAAEELSGYATAVEAADAHALRLAAIGVNACAVRAVFSILSARGAGAVLGLVAAQGGAS